VLLSGVGPALADPLSAPPPPHEGLIPIEAADLSALPPETRTAITLARERVGSLLSEEATSPEQLATAYGELGALYQVNDMLTSAEAAFDNATTLAPTELRWVYFTGYLNLDSGRAKRALAQFERARELDPDYAPLSLRRAQALLELSRLDEARALFGRALETPGLAAAAHNGLGQIALLQRRYADAIAEFNATLTLDPNASAVHYPLAQALHARGQDELAREQRAKRGRDLPGVDDPLLAELEAHANPSLAQFRRGMVASRASQWAEAAEAFGAGVALSPGNTHARISYARALFLSGDREGARAELERVLAEDPENTLALFLLAVLDEAAGREDAANRGYHQVMALEPDHAGANFYLGQDALRSERYEQASRYFEAAIAVEPSNIPAYLYRDVALERLGARATERVGGLEGALRRSPEDPLVRYRLARLLAVAASESVRNPKRALEMAQSLVAEQPAPQHLELLALGRAANGEFEAAAELLESLIAMAAFGPPQESARLEQSLAAYRAGHLPEAGPDPSSAFLGTPPRVEPTGPMRDYPAAQPF
jgi:tetratricopeptide (TPR) repeat protein